MIVFRGSLVVAAALWLAACNLFKDPDSTSPSRSGATDNFSGTLSAQGTAIFNFTVAQSGTVTVQLSATSATTPLGLGLGTPNASSCPLTTSTRTATAATSPQISVSVSSGSYCVEVFDPGNLAASATFTVAVGHP